MKVSNSIIQFRIDIDFEDCDVDVVYQEARQAGYQGSVPAWMIKPHTHHIKGDKTPISKSIDFCLSWLSGYVDRNKMCTTSSKWDKDYSKPFVTKYTNDGFKYAGAEDVETELDELGIKVISTDGLMMGTCNLMCEVDAEQFSLELVNQANKIVFEVFKKYALYYKKGRKITA